MTVASEIPLFSHALIEASAGSGKTWTLTGIVLRLLLEEDIGQGVFPREPKAIVATTFTRKAAAEMRRRVEQRLTAFQTLLRGIAVAYDGGVLDLGDDERLDRRIAALLAAWAQGDEPSSAAVQGDRLPALDDEQIAARNQAACDAINEHILLTAVRSDGLNGLIALFKRTEQRLSDSEALFIGTFDSLCQRWLGEYALETGADTQREIVDGDAAITALVHDRLRRLYAEHYRATPARMAAFAENTCTVSDYVRAVKERLVFADATLDAVSVAPFDTTAYRRALARMRAIDAKTSLDAIFAEDVQNLLKKQGNGKKFLAMAAPQRLWRALAGDAPLSGHEWAGACAWADLIVTGNGFRTAKEVVDAVARWRADPLNILLAEVVELRAARDRQGEKEQEALAGSFAAKVYECVRKELPQRLEARGKTTFSEQIARLDRALAGPGGEALGRDIAYRYPVILVDEAQDLNGAQRALLERVYLQEEKAEGFLLLVGDPKQAIYRFRGGDVANYHRLKARFPAERRYTLKTNFRSSAPLVAALNSLYAQAPPLGKDIVYTRVNAAAEGPRAVLGSNGATIDDPLQWYEVDSKDGEPEQVLAIVQALTATDSRYGKRGKDGQIIPLRHSDIQILMARNRNLEDVQQLLQKNGIATAFAAQSNIFSGRMAEALLSLFEAIETPQDRGIVNRLLATILFAQTLGDIRHLGRIANGETSAAADELTYDALHTALHEAGKDWKSRHPLSALQRFLARALGGRSIWQRLAAYPSPDGERYLLDLRQLQQIIAEHGRMKRPRMFLRWWRHCLADPPQADWAIETPLPGKDAVQLMTIHKAKGLQSPVVIVSGLGGVGTAKKNVEIHAYHDENGVLRLSSMPLTEAQQASVAREEGEEQARLLYVALTRAEDLLFVGVRDDTFRKNHRHPALQALRPQRCFAARYHRRLPADPAAIRRALSQSRPRLTNPDAAAQRKTQVAPYKKTHFYGWRKTSFSALARDRVEKKESVDCALPDFAVAADDGAGENAAKKESASALPFCFPRGANPGSFLHAVLERLDVDAESAWPPLLERLARRYRLLGEDTPLAAETFVAYRRWLGDILDSSLVSGTTLRQLAPAQRVNEMDFHLAVDTSRPLDVTALNRLFHDWGKPLQLENSEQIYGFIRGEIDVCYHHAGRYHVLDYKSNHLGDCRARYHVTAMTQAMDDHHYWLQALIYQTALHRFLKNRLPDYSPHKHLGAPEYLFLRGCAADSDSGHLPVVIEPALLLAFDALLGSER